MQERQGSREIKGYAVMQATSRVITESRVLLHPEGMTAVIGNETNGEAKLVSGRLMKITQHVLLFVSCFPRVLEVGRRRKDEEAGARDWCQRCNHTG